MILTSIRDDSHGLTQYELILKDSEIVTGMEFMDPARREYTKLLMQSDKCSRRLTGHLEVALALEEMEALELASRTGGDESHAQEAH